MAQPQSQSLSAETEKLSHVMGLVEAFRAFDSDNDGAITSQELGGILSSLGYKTTGQDVTDMMREGDGNKDGLLSLEEFLDMNTKDMEFGSLSNLFGRVLESVNVVAGEDEFVTGDDLHAVMENVGADMSLSTCREIIASMDGDGDGAVSVEDLQLILTRLL